MQQKLVSQCVEEAVLHPPQPPSAPLGRAGHHCPRLHKRT